MNVKELIEKLQKCDPELQVNTWRNQFSPEECDVTNYWVTHVEEYPLGSSGYEEDGEVLLITSE
tara:strand:+ start:286 stop:477 length:192 start_codon:yes stop_codon:yes gene_type:complete